MAGCQHINFGSAEKGIGTGANGEHQGPQNATVNFDHDAEQQGHEGHDFEHWDPMTRGEFAPSEFAASSIVLKEGSGLAESLHTDVAAAKSFQRHTKTSKSEKDNQVRDWTAPQRLAESSAHISSAADKNPSNSTKGCQLYVGNLIDTITEQDLSEFFIGFDM